jgi:hypothetical protein
MLAALTFGPFVLRMILSENRFPRFGIMRSSLGLTDPL